MNTIIKLPEKIVVVLLAFYVIMLPFAFSMFAEYQVLTLSVVFLSACICISVVRYTGHRIIVTWVDAAMLLFFIYEWAHIAMSRNFQIDELVYYEWVALGMIYWLSRMPAIQSHILWLLFAVVLSGALQSLVGILQYGGILKSGNEDFVLTGCFGNPGPLGGYLAISFVSAVCVLMRNRSLVWRVIGIALLVGIGMILIGADSRAGWLAVLIPCLFLLYKIRLSAIKNKIGKNMLCVALVILCIIVATAFYQYKKTSADVRLLIWTVGVEMFANAPLCGHGIGSFAMEYMEYQARYFECHPHSEYTSLSDNNTQAFNELLTILCEQGIIGGFFVLFILYVAFCGKETFGVRTLLLSLCFFSCFSYTGDIFPLKVFFPLFLGIIPCRRLLEVPIKKKIFTSFTFLPLCFLFLLSIKTKNRYEIAFSQLQRNNPQIILHDNKEYMSRYLQLLLEREDYEKFILFAADTDFPFMTSVLKCDIGACYMRMGENEKAEVALKNAYWMVPSKVLPKYLLFTLYRETGNSEKACEKAKEILTLKVSKVGSTYLTARAESKAYLRSEACVERRRRE